MSEKTPVKSGQAGKAEDMPDQEPMEMTPEQAEKVKGGIGPVDGVIQTGAPPVGPIDGKRGF